MGWQSDVLNGLGVDLAARSLGTWDPSGGTGTIVRGALPDEVDTGIGMQAYRIGSDDAARPTTQLRVQFWIRATEAGIDDLDSGLYDALQGLAGRVYGGTVLTLAQAISSLPMGVDERGRAARACNYRLDLDLPATAQRSL